MRKRYGRRHKNRRGYRHKTHTTRRGKTRRIPRYGSSRGGIRL